MEKKVLLKQFEFQIIETSAGIQIEKRPFSLIFLGLGIGIGAALIVFLGTLATTEVLQMLLKGFSYLIEILAAVFILIGLVSFLPRFKVQMRIDSKSKTIVAGSKVYNFSEVQSLQLAPLGSSFVTLQFSLQSAPHILRLLTLPVSKMDVIEKLKKDFEQVFKTEILAARESTESSKSSNSPETLQQQGDQSRKMTFIFTEILGILCAVIFYFAFNGLVIQSRYSEGVQIPFWGLGVMIMLLGVFNFFKKKK